MKSVSETNQELEMKWPDGIWESAVAGMFKPAQELLSNGHVLQAIENARQTHLTNYGPNDPCQFRVKTVVLIFTGDVELTEGN